MLSTLDHPNVVRVIDLTKMVEGRLTLVMERVGGETLRQWLALHPTPEPTTFSGGSPRTCSPASITSSRSRSRIRISSPTTCSFSDGRLTIIDFSLAAMPEDAPYGGTALYRDPASARWTHATDRFAAALCLFELYAGRHAFEGRVPEPGQAPAVREDDIEPSGLGAFFRKALDPVPEKRFPSARAMRDALLVALGEDVATASLRAPSKQLDATTPLRLTGLSRRAINALARCQVHTVGELLALPPAQVRAIHAIGTKTANDIIAFQEALLGRGVAAATAAPTRADPPLVPDLMRLAGAGAEAAAWRSAAHCLRQAGLPTVGAVASLTRTELLGLPGIGRKRLRRVVEALHQFRAPRSEQ